MKKGIESLMEEVKKNCIEGRGCFNVDGCNCEVGCKVLKKSPSFIELYTNNRDEQSDQCRYPYCTKLKWIMDRAQQYADFIGISRDEVIQAWEENRTYWYMNYYQECNQPSLNGDIRVLRLNDWISELQTRFGNNSDNWKFVCPSCGHVQSVLDFKKLKYDPQRVYINCIGRITGSNDRSGKNGCNYTVSGLVPLNKTTVINEKHIPVKVFEMAD